MITGKKQAKRGHIQVFFRLEIYEAMRELADKANLPVSTWARLVLTKRVEALLRSKAA